MLDIKLIRENKDKINELLKHRNSELSVDEIVEIDAQRRKIQFEADDFRAQRKNISQEIGNLKKQGADTTKIQEEVRVLGDKIKELEEREIELENKQKNLLLNTPNTPDESVTVGVDETYNKEIKKVGTPKKPNFVQKPHWDIASERNLVDFERGVKISQSRFTLYRGRGAMLERAIINFFLDLHINEHGYEEVLPPILVNSASMTGTGQLPKFAQDMYKVEEDDLYLIPTAEVPVTNIYADEILNEDDLPYHLCAYTPCFRKEAGSAGKDTRGLIRLHQFNKVELVKICLPEKSEEEHEKLTANAEKTLELLELPYRRMELCTGDMGFSAKKCYDIEVWLPSYDSYKEISSCSNFGDFQARRANIRYRSKETGKTNFVHTLNGSGLAVGRTFAAILENYQQEDGSILIPKALQKYTDFERI